MKREKASLMTSNNEGMFTVDDVLLNKAESIERCLQRIKQEYEGHENELQTNYSRQDAIILNLQRACEASIDAAMRIVRVEKLGVPQESREAFELLEKNGFLELELSNRMKRMMGFRNIAIHDYQKLNIEILESILKNHLDDFRQFSAFVIEKSKSEK